MQDCCRSARSWKEGTVMYLVILALRSAEAIALLNPGGNGA